MFFAEDVGLGPVPVSVKSDSLASTLLGELAGREAMFDFGESRTLVLLTEREKRDKRLALPWCMLSVTLVSTT